MTKVIDYYMTLISPWAYLGSQRLADIAKRHGAEVRVLPVNYGEVFPRTGGLPLAKRAPERQAYRMMELKRWRTYLDVPINLEPAYFPTPEAIAAGMVIAAGDSGGRPLELAQAFGRAIWEQERNIAHESTCREVAGETGHDGADLLARAQDPAMAQRHAEQTETSIARGVFGAPTYVYKDELFWGQDRLDFLDRALAD
ncbi:2-hydroxychromene-2-carboxylate isomerase [Pelagibius litoralis]|uniref:2-hydroxychromene-2-carboxylate isomerase n=1 Tax=Pelagibius litoralis TaxID=374515 RepID=A0A967KII7_9PROT|nr:2-hydroxychromene-2-carboxylate isomerase [Pelagibius litoralis]NIA72331.1 2-hydroxychromene-2-carboxylate isomerase [Pelagibius litoralis]